MRLADYAQFRVPPGFIDAVATAAEQENISASEFMRRAILADVEERTRDDDGPDARDDSGTRGSL